MSVTELQVAIKNVVDLLQRSKLQSAVNDFRSFLIAGDNVRAKHQLKLASAQLIAGMAKLSSTERSVCKLLHLSSLGSAKYWESLLEQEHGLRQARAECVHLYSRIMFAVNHLPSLVSLLQSEISNSVSDDLEAKNIPSKRVVEHQIKSGHDLLKIRLLDAGEKATDPDRISRTVDGIDMVYTACVSIARKPATDLAVVSITGERHKDMVFEGDMEGVSAVHTVISSIADQLSEVEDVENFDPDAIIAALPVFEDLNTLKRLGSFRAEEAGEISETMHEGAMLIMESGVLLADELAKMERDETFKGGGAQIIELPMDEPKKVSKLVSKARVVSEDDLPIVKIKRIESSNGEVASGDLNVANSDTSQDEFYNQYLREKEKLQGKERQEVVSSDALALFSMSHKAEVSEPRPEDQKSDALSELILDLDRITK